MLAAISTHSRFVDFMADHPIVKAADVVIATSAIVSALPPWRDQLHAWGGVFTDVAPIFAVVWFLVQIYCKLDAHRRNIVLDKRVAEEEDDGEA